MPFASLSTSDSGAYKILPLKIWEVDVGGERLLCASVLTHAMFWEGDNADFGASRGFTVGITSHIKRLASESDGNATDQPPLITALVSPGALQSYNSGAIPLAMVASPIITNSNLILRFVKIDEDQQEGLVDNPRELRRWLEHDGGAWIRDNDNVVEFAFRRATILDLQGLLGEAYNDVYRASARQTADTSGIEGQVASLESQVASLTSIRGSLERALAAEKRRLQAVTTERDRLRQAAGNAVGRDAEMRDRVSKMTYSLRESLIIENSQVLILTNPNTRAVDFTARCYLRNGRWQDISVSIAAHDTVEIGTLQGWAGNFVSGEKVEARVGGRVVWTIRIE